MFIGKSFNWGIYRASKDKGKGKGINRAGKGVVRAGNGNKMDF